MVRDNRRCSTYLFGAICPARGLGAAIISQAANTTAMNFHLTEIASQVAPGARAVVLIDGAGWHEKAKDLRVPDNITLMTLPPYSPELNAMELELPAGQQALQHRLERRGSHQHRLPARGLPRDWGCRLEGVLLGQCSR